MPGSFVKILQRINERSCVALLLIVFAILSAIVASVPYDPSTDLADATTNRIWVEQYSHGIHHIPYDEWTYGITQSVVVEYRGEYVVVNEKGPGHVAMMLPFYMAGIGNLFPVLMMGLAVLGSYMLGKRLLGWQTGFIAALLVMFNLVVIVMWHRYYWTDASTMHLMVLAFWLLVEGNYRYNGRSLDPGNDNAANHKDRLIGTGLCILSGLAFGLSVSTRYPTGLLVAAFALYLLGFYLLRMRPSLKMKEFRSAMKRAMPLFLLLAAFAIGLMCVLVPLTRYNSEYFGGPFNSGYDATSLIDFNRTGTLDVRNTTAVWTGNLGSYISTAFGNLARLAPTFLARMPALIFLPLGIYCMRGKEFQSAVLLLWIGINFFTYLSLDWVGMYARTDLVPWEPRYWMPSLPAIALIGGFGIHKLAGWLAERVAHKYDFTESGRKASRVIFAGAIVGMLVICSAVPAIGYLQNPEVRGGNPPPPNQQAILVTTDQLLANPTDYVGKAVLLNDAVVTGRSFAMMDVRSIGSSSSDAIAVSFIDYPQGTLPVYPVGQHVVVRGVFSKAPTPVGAPPIYYLGVRYGTDDYTRPLQ